MPIGLDPEALGPGGGAPGGLAPDPGGGAPCGLISCLLGFGTFGGVTGLFEGPGHILSIRFKGRQDRQGNFVALKRTQNVPKRKW